jgi:hypothetical protein
VRNLLKLLVGARGFEPPTPCSQSRCATRLRHAPIFKHIVSNLLTKGNKIKRILTMDDLVIQLKAFEQP